MKSENLLTILEKLKELVEELETEIKADVNNYSLDIDYQEVLDYYRTNDDDGDGI